MVRHTTESYEDTLSRLDIPVEATTDIETFQEYLKEELGITNVEFMESLWEAQKGLTALEEHGIKAVPIEYPWGTEVRYAIQGLPGLWGKWAVEEIREAEMW